MKESTFKERLELALKIRNMRQIDLANKTNLDKSLISSYLKGKYEAKQENVDVISKVLNVNPVWLMGYNIPMEAEFELIDETEFNEEVVNILKDNILNTLRDVSIDKKIDILDELVWTLQKIRKEMKDNLESNN